MQETRLIMGMPITLKLVDKFATKADLEAGFAYFTEVDKKYSPFKTDNELAKINTGELKLTEASQEMQEIFRLCEETKKLTDGFFDIFHEGRYNPSGLVKGWAIKQAVELLKKRGLKNYYVDAGGDIEVSGLNEKGKSWQVGIRNPFNRFENVKIINLKSGGIATSGTAIRGEHIYSPKGNIDNEIVSLTVIGPDVYEADRMATAAFAMGRLGITFIASLSGFSGYMIDKYGQAFATANFGD